MKHTIIFAAALSVTSFAWSQVQKAGCKSPQTTIEANECAKAVLAQKDKELNAAYQQLTKRLTAPDKSDTTDYEEVKKLLLEGQRNWIRFKDADCKAKYKLSEGGTIRDVVYLGCLADHTEQRTRQLLKWADG